MKDARERAERLAKSQGKSVGEPWSISEFNVRGDEVWRLVPDRHLMGKSSGVLAEALAPRDYPGEPFEPGKMEITVKLYVVYLLK